MKGTDFQLKVWEALLKIPMGGLTTYGDIAAGINHPKAFRAVGTAVGENPVALLIPCHRVIRSTGYRCSDLVINTIKNIFIQKKGIRTPKFYKMDLDINDVYKIKYHKI